MAVDPDPETQIGPGVIEASHDAVDAEALLVPVVGGREEGARTSVGVELGDHPRGGLIRESRRSPGLRGDHQPVGAPVPADGEDPLGVRVVLEPAQPQLEEARRDGAMRELHLLGHGSEPAHRAGDDRHPRRQVGAPRLDVDAPRSQNVVVADSLDACESGGVVDQVAHRPRSGASGSPVSLRRPPSHGPPDTGEPGLQSGMQLFHRAPPIVRAGCRGCFFERFLVSPVPEKKDRKKDSGISPTSSGNLWLPGTDPPVAEDVEGGGPEELLLGVDRTAQRRVDPGRPARRADEDQPRHGKPEPGGRLERLPLQGHRPDLRRPPEGHHLPRLALVPPDGLLGQ